MVDIQDEQAAAVHQLRLKIADLEDSSRRNNIKIRGVSESLAATEIIPYLHQLFRGTLPI